MFHETETPISGQEDGRTAGGTPDAARAEASDRLVAQACKKIQDRLDGLRPYVVEFNLLRVALLGIESRMPASPDRPRTRSEQVFASIYLDPGLTTQEVATDSGIALSSLYPILRGLEDQGLAHRISRCWYPGPRDAGGTSLLDVASA